MSSDIKDGVLLERLAKLHQLYKGAFINEAEFRALKKTLFLDERVTSGFAIQPEPSELEFQNNRLETALHVDLNRDSGDAANRRQSGEPATARKQSMGLIVAGVVSDYLNGVLTYTINPLVLIVYYVMNR